MTEVACVAESGDVLGEGPCWDSRTGRLYWLDIKGRRLLAYEPGSERRHEWPLGWRASAMAPRALGDFLMATERGLALFDPESGVLSMHQPMPMEAGFRSNEGMIDPQGRFWWSLMDDNGGLRPGAVFRTDPDWTTHRVLEGIHISNTLAVTADGGTLFLADSRLQTLFAYDLDAAGAPSNRRVFAHTVGEPGSPDGSAIDAEGYLWNAQWGASRVVRYAPDGRIDGIVEMPVTQPSSCAFGGEGLDRLYVTSAREGLSEAALAKQPQAGGLFVFDPGVKGLELPMFEG